MEGDAATDPDLEKLVAELHQCVGELPRPRRIKHTNGKEPLLVEPAVMFLRSVNETIETASDLLAKGGFTDEQGDTYFGYVGATMKFRSDIEALMFPLDITPPPNEDSNQLLQDLNDAFSVFGQARIARLQLTIDNEDYFNRNKRAINQTVNYFGQLTELCMLAVEAASRPHAPKALANALRLKQEQACKFDDFMRNYESILEAAGRSTTLGDPVRLATLIDRLHLVALVKDKNEFYVPPAAVAMVRGLSERRDDAVVKAARIANANGIYTVESDGKTLIGTGLDGGILYLRTKFGEIRGEYFGRAPPHQQAMLGQVFDTAFNSFLMAFLDAVPSIASREAFKEELELCNRLLVWDCARYAARGNVDVMHSLLLQEKLGFGVQRWYDAEKKGMDYFIGLTLQEHGLKDSEYPTRGLRFVSSSLSGQSDAPLSAPDFAWVERRYAAELPGIPLVRPKKETTH